MFLAKKWLPSKMCCGSNSATSTGRSSRKKAFAEIDDPAVGRAPGRMTGLGSQDQPKVREKTEAQF